MKLKNIKELYPKDYYLQYSHYLNKKDLEEVPLFFYIKKMMQNIGHKEKVVSLGCGLGYLMNWLGQIFQIPLVFGLDFNLEALLLSKEKFKRLKLINGCIQNLPFGKEEFDVVIMINLIEHLTYPEKGLKEAFRVLKSGGNLILSTVDRNSLYTKIWIRDRTHMHEFSQVEILNLIKNIGFKLEQKIFTNSIGRFSKELNYFLSKIFPADFLILAKRLP